MVLVGPSSRHRTSDTGFEGWNGLASVSCLSRRFCVAVGSSTRGPLAEVWNGAVWKIVATPTRLGAGTSNTDDARFTGVSCAASDACTAVGTVGSATLVERWDGNKWTVERTANRRDTFSQLNGVSCPTPTTCVAVGTGAGTLERQHVDGDPGTELERRRPRAGGVMPGVDRLYRGGTRTTGILLERDTLDADQSAQAAAGSIPQLHGVSCSSVTFCLAVGSQERENGSTVSYAYVWDGMTWTAQRPGPASEFHASVAVSSAARRA